MSVIKVATMKNMIVLHHLKLKYPFPFSVSYFNLLHSSTNQELFEKYFFNQGSHSEKYGRFPLPTEESHQHVLR